MPNYDPQNFESVILYMRYEFGASVFREPGRLYSIICDLSPKMRPYGNVLRQLSGRGTLAELDAARNDDTRRNRAMMKARDILENELLLGSDRVEYFIGVLRTLYGIEPPKPAAPPPVQKQPQLPNLQPAPIAQSTPESLIITRGKCGDNVTFTLDENGLLTISGTGTIGDFEWDSNKPLWTPVREVKIPNGVTEIGKYAFAHMLMTHVTIPDSVIVIGECAFDSCHELTSVTIPDNVKEIKAWTFADCYQLTSVAIPNSVTTIGMGAFMKCVSLKSVNIPNSVTVIESGAFGDCEGLTSVTIPNSVTKIQEETFDGCEGLTNVTIPDSVTVIGEKAFMGCKGLTNVTIPNSVTVIESFAFDGCKGLTSVTIPNSVTKIEEYAFGYCEGLTNVTILGSATEIGWNVFHYCENLKNVNLPANSKIPDYAFPSSVRITRR